MSNQESVLIIFTKAPVPGKVKTRLISALGEEEAAQFYQALLLRTLGTATMSDVSAVQLWCDPDSKHPFLIECEKKFNVSLWDQMGNNLGERMFNAINKATQDFERVILIGCDCPSITPDDIHAANKKIKRGMDVVLGPAIDGGYYLIACHTAYEDIFRDINWGGPTVLDETRHRIRQRGLKWSEVEKKRDVDEPEDLEWFKKVYKS